MERGLLWLPLLLLFIGLAWAGWAEYQKIEVYQRWAADFEQAKYDIYAVLGYRNSTITWGKATRQGMIKLQQMAIADIAQISLTVDDQSITELEKLPQKGKPHLVLHQKNSDVIQKIPFTEIELAAKWVKYLQQKLVGLS